MDLNHRPPGPEPVGRNPITSLGCRAYVSCLLQNPASHGLHVGLQTPACELPKRLNPYSQTESCADEAEDEVSLSRKPQKSSTFLVTPTRRLFETCQKLILGRPLRAILYCFRLAPEMNEQVFGLTVNEVMAYAAIANVALVFVLIAINTFYACGTRCVRQTRADNRQSRPIDKPTLRRGLSTCC
jgi:hypothetical protein